MSSIAFNPQASCWLAENGAKHLEFLFRSFVFPRSTPILIADNERNSWEASIGASKLLGLPREKIIGRRLDDFSQPSFKRGISGRWRSFLQSGEQEGTLHLMGNDGRPHEIEYCAKGDVLPVRHLLMLRDKSKLQLIDEKHSKSKAWAQDFALLLLTADRSIATWYAGSERIYGYKCDEVMGQPESILCGTMDRNGIEKTGGTGSEVYLGKEAWQVKKDGSRFWANVITMALRDETGNLQGFAMMVQDLSNRCEIDQSPKGNKRLYSVPSRSTIVGIISGGFEREPEANDAFLELVGYSREDLETGRLNWPSLTPPEYGPEEDQANEEVWRLGACKPFEKELIRKDGIRIPVLVATAVVKPSPFEWITFVQAPSRISKGEPLDEVVNEGSHTFTEMKGNSGAMLQAMNDVAVVAPTDATVLILGETGTGKELIARAIHKSSRRSNAPFITLNCAAIPTGLLESELFGYERGAFTGALSQKIGRFEMANGGTLFLDEVGDIPLELQPKLLRALQEKEFERLGGTKTIPINVRLVAATNRNLAEMMRDNLFRRDLYYRLNVFPVNTPALRDRPEDIPELVYHFIAKYAQKMDRIIETIPSDTMRALMNWSWPGNVRELENFIERSIILSRGTTLCAPISELQIDSRELADRGATLEEVERDHILRVFRENGGVVSSTAARLGLKRTTLNALMKRLMISRNDLGAVS